MLRKLSVLAACGLMTWGVAACGGDDGESAGGGGGGGGEAAKIALLLPESKTTRYEQQDRPRFEARVKEICADCEVIYQNADQDSAQQAQQADSALTQGAKALVISAVDVQAAGSIVQKARAQNVPVISYGRLIADAPLDYYVSIDPYEVGKQQAEALLEAQAQRGKDSPRVVMINGSPTDSNSAPYKQGAEDVFNEAGAEVVGSFDVPDWSPDKAQQQMSQWLTSLGEDGFDAVYVANDGMATGAISALRAAGVDLEALTVTGQDAEVAGLQQIVAGSQLMTVYQPIPELAKTSADIAVAVARGEDAPELDYQDVDNGGGQPVKSVLLPTIAIGIPEIRDVIFKDGFATAEQVCTKQYRDACEQEGLLE